MTAQRPRGVLQIGCGGFGQVHLQAWYALGLGDALYVADPDPLARERATRLNLPPERIAADFRDVLDRAEVVDVVASTALNAELCLAALAAGKDVFVEKPMTVTTGEALRVAEAERASGGRVVQVGYYFRHHPLARRAKAWLDAGELGTLRYLSGTFAGFKRARRDIGVTQSDAVHFIDLFNWFTGSLPVEAFAVTRDHFGRGLEDLSLVLLTYPGGVVAKVESGLVQPGRRHDTVMPNAHTTKEVAVSGSEAAF
ncbi:MAG TPA: Gfo/Idh/MocA family oxidoreductase, partial [Geminicoccaceae bacterium]|nr:Gfo/Idh/MocA family oxidoreductase [Geminicoccaceae bacterium]